MTDSMRQRGSRRGLMPGQVPTGRTQRSLRAWTGRAVVLSAVLVFVIPAAVAAFSSIGTTWSTHYPTSLARANAGCQLCHGSDTSTWNPYGWAIRQGGGDAAAIAAAEGANSDADPGGISNLGEINANAQPGWTLGNNNKIYYADGTFDTGQPVPAGISGLIDPVAAPDLTAPIATAPGASLRSAVGLSGTAIPVRLAWTGADNVGGSGIARFELERSADAGTTWTPVSASLTTTSANVTVAASGTVQFRVRPVDQAGNIGNWATGPVLSPRLVQQTSTAVKYGRTWTSTSSTAYSGGSAKYAKVAGASAAYTFTGRSIALVTTKAPTRGKVKIYVNGTLAATVDLYSRTAKYRVLAWQKTWATSGSRTVKLVVAGTSGRPRVDLDAFAVVK